MHGLRILFEKDTLESIPHDKVNKYLCLVLVINISNLHKLSSDKYLLNMKLLPAGTVRAKRKTVIETEYRL